MENLKYAGFLKRFAAYILDNFIMYIVYFLISFLIMGNPFAGLDPDLAMEDSGAAEALMGKLLLTSLLSFVLYIVYFAYFESSQYQATLGKQLLKIKVTNLDGNPVSFLQALGRNLGKIISGIIIMIGYLMAAFTAKKQALHDMMASTLVVDSKAPKDLNVDYV